MVAGAARVMSSNVGVKLHVRVRISAQWFCERIHFMEILGQSRGVLGYWGGSLNWPELSGLACMNRNNPPIARHISFRT